MKQYESFQSWGYPKFAGWFMSGSIHFRKMGDVFLGYPHDELETPWNLRPRGPGTSWAFLEVHQASCQARFPPPAHLRLGVVRQKMMPLDVWYLMLCSGLFCSDMFCYVLLCSFMLCCIMWCYVCMCAQMQTMQSNAMYVMWWDGMFSRVMSCHAMPRHLTYVYASVFREREWEKERKKRQKETKKKREK